MLMNKVSHDVHGSPPARDSESESPAPAEATVTVTARLRPGRCGRGRRGGLTVGFVTRHISDSRTHWCHSLRLSDSAAGQVESRLDSESPTEDGPNHCAPNGGLP
jgi:hypothetical protein